MNTYFTSPSSKNEILVLNEYGKYFIISGLSVDKYDKNESIHMI